MKLVIGLVGEKGSGKETFAQTLIDLLRGRVHSERFSDVLSETLASWDIPRTRAHLQRMAVIMREEYGPETLTHTMYVRVSKREEDVVIIDGIRWETDVAMLRTFPTNLLVYITADPLIRYERTKKRSTKTGEAGANLEQFMKEEKAKNEILIPQIGVGADYCIINNGSIEDFKAHVRKFSKQHLSYL